MSVEAFADETFGAADAFAFGTFAAAEAHIVVPANTVQFVLKKNPGSNLRFKYGPDVYDPMWFICKEREIEKTIRFAGLIGETGWMEVHCYDAMWSFMFSSRMFWEVKQNGKKIRCLTRRGRVINCSDSFKELNYNIKVIRLHVYWVLRGIVGFKLLLARVHMRHKKRKLFIQATYWGDPNCKLSRFSGTINTPVKQRIHAFI